VKQPTITELKLKPQTPVMVNYCHPLKVKKSTTKEDVQRVFFIQMWNPDVSSIERSGLAREKLGKSN